MLPISCSPIQPALLGMLRTGDADQVRDVLIEIQPPSAGDAAMHWLRANRPTIADQALCLYYGMWWHQVGALGPEYEQHKWFVSVDPESTLTIDGLPVFDSPEQLCTFVVRHFRLENTFYGQRQKSN